MSSTQNKFLSPSPYVFQPMIKKSSISMLIKSARKRMKKADVNERYALTVILEEMQDLKDKL